MTDCNSDTSTNCGSYSYNTGNKRTGGYNHTTPEQSYECGAYDGKQWEESLLKAIGTLLDRNWMALLTSQCRHNEAETLTLIEEGSDPLHLIISSKQ